jgi:hypothetical protein
MDEPKMVPVEKKAAPMAAAAKKAVEEWATAKGMMPQWVIQPAIRQGQYLVAVPPSHNPEYWKFAAAKGGENWTIGAEVTESDFDAAVERWTVGHRHG